MVHQQMGSMPSHRIFLGQHAPSSNTSSTYSPSRSHSGVEAELQSGSTATTEPFSMHLYRQQPRSEPFHTSLGARGGSVVVSVVVGNGPEVVTVTIGPSVGVVVSTVMVVSTVVGRGVAGALAVAPGTGVAADVTAAAVGGGRVEGGVRGGGVEVTGDEGDAVVTLVEVRTEGTAVDGRGGAVVASVGTMEGVAVVVVVSFGVTVVVSPGVTVV
ncbi:hypothetical protein EYF80_055104 [Liparis tanakae]|uniref:Uncharacterized protein n=1 Tax=Liparis tanakae TaxID=230148 RepID=A0A4Z2F225_9TELE|nr:hypothetical protein EYF80_055104 [Liparis tanakae]